MQAEGYYLTRKDDLLLEFDAEARRWQAELVHLYGGEAADQIIFYTKVCYEKLIPQFPYIGGNENHLTGTLVDSARCLALYLTMKTYACTAAEAGDVLFAAILSRSGEIVIPSPDVESLSPDQMIERRRKRAERSQQRYYPDDFVYTFVPGDGVAFDYGYDFSECAVQKFYHRQGADEFLPFYCALDYAWSRLTGYGFSHEMTLAEGFLLCNHRFKANV